MHYFKYDPAVQGYTWTDATDPAAIAFTDAEYEHAMERGGFEGWFTKNPDNTLTKDQAAIDAEMFPVLQEQKRDEIRAAFRVAETAPVPDPLGGMHLWHGGYESAAKLHNACTMAMESGLTSVTFYDAENSGHTLPLDDAKAVALAVGGKYQQDLATKQGLMAQIDQASTLGELAAIQWEKV